MAPLSGGRSRLECLRAKANERVRKEHATPRLFQTTVWAFRIGPGTDSERRHLDARFSMLPTGSPLTADAGFISYELCAELLRRSVHFV